MATKRRDPREEDEARARAARLSQHKTLLLVKFIIGGSVVGVLLIFLIIYVVSETFFSDFPDAIKAREMYAEFKGNEVAAEERYSGDKELMVLGWVADKGENGNGLYVTLSGEHDSSKPVRSALPR